MTEHKQSPDEIISSLEKKLTALQVTNSRLVAENILLRDLYEKAPLGYQSLDENGCFLFVNQAWVEGLGYSREEVIGRNFSDFLHPDWRDHFKENFPRFKAIGEILGVEFEMIKKDGSTILVSFHGKIGKSSQGRFQQTHCIFQDITEFRRVQEEYKLFFDLVPDMVCIASTEGYFKKLNRAWLSVLGYSIEELLAAPFLDLVHPDDKQDTVAEVKKQISGGRTIHFVNRYRHKDGSYRWFEWHATPVVGEGLLFAVARDVTERKRAEQNYQNLFREMLDGFALHEIVYNEMGAPINYRFLAVNPAFERLTGLKASDIVGRTVQEVLPGIEDHWIESYGRVVITGEPAFFESSSDNLKKYFEVRAYRPAPNQFACIFADISERKKADKERKTLQAQLQQAQKMEAIGNLAGGIAHDFNNILGAILGYAEMAQEDNLSGQVNSRDLDQIIKAGNRAKDLVKQILAFSRQAVAQKIQLRPAAIVRESIMLLRSSIPKTIDIREDIDTQTDLILADPTQVHQIIMNVCTNAYHAMEESGGTLSISLKNRVFYEKDLVNVPHVKPGKFVQLVIRDSGLGIPPENQERIFDPYFTTKGNGKGTGMGLAIVHGIVKSYGGFITCRSELGIGTVFEINQPAFLGKNLPEPEKNNAIPIGAEHILFIDDEEILAEMGKTMLERLGYTVTVRTNSLAALTTFKNQPDAFDLVITDQTMPGITGFDLARRMLQIRPNLPIILCTGFSSLISEEKAKSVGIREFALKPLSLKDISVMIRAVLMKKRENFESIHGLP